MPAIIAVAIIYFLFLAPQQDQINGAKNDLAASNVKIEGLTTLTASKAGINEFDGKFSLMNSNMSNMSSRLSFFEPKLQDFLSRIVILEQKSDTATSAISGINGNITSFFTSLSSLKASYDSNIASVKGDISGLQTQLNDFRNSTYLNYTDMLDWATSLDINQTALNNSMRVILSQQSLIQGNETAILSRLDVLCAYNSSWC